MIVKTQKTLGGVTYDYSYSDAGKKIERDGALYDEAVDPEGSGREYRETDIALSLYDEEAEAEDYLSALCELGLEREAEDDKE